MFELVSIAAILTVTFLSVAVGIVWHSPALFGRLWAEGAGKPYLIESHGAHRFRKYGWHLLSLFIIQYFLAHFVIAARELGVEIWQFSLWLTILVSLSHVGSTLWEERPLSYLLVTVGYIAIIVIGSMHVIAFWPW